MASDTGFDLEAAGRRIEWYLSDGDRARALTQALFKPADDPLLESFFEFRSNRVTRTVQYASMLARSQGLSIGLDCFSPSVTRMVGQDLSTLDKSCDWIKLMTYPRVFGPAGLPFELNALLKWLRDSCNVNEMEAAQLVARASGLSFTGNGLNSESMTHEIQRGRNAGITNLLAGIALVEVEGIHQPKPEQVEADLAACCNAQADGLVLSWDLWHIHSQFLKSVQVVLQDGNSEWS
jgi:hypothetical protein